MPQRSPAHAALGRSIRRSRGRRGISQEELASLSGLHRTYVGGIERGERNPSYTNTCGSRKRWGSGLRSCWPRLSATRLSRGRRRPTVRLGWRRRRRRTEPACSPSRSGVSAGRRAVSPRSTWASIDLVDASDDGVCGDVPAPVPCRHLLLVAGHHERAEAIHRGRAAGQGLRSRGEHLDHADVRQRGLLCQLCDERLQPQPYLVDPRLTAS